MTTSRAWSLGQRLLLWLVVPLLVLCALLLVEAYFSARAAANKAYDRVLQASALAIAERVVLLDGYVDVDLPYAALQMLASTAQDRVFYRITDTDGSFVTGYADLPHSMTSDENQPGAAARFYDAHYRGDSVRVAILSKPVLTGNVTIEIAQTRDERSALTWELAWSTATRLLLLVGLAGALIWLGVRRSLDPLAELRQELRSRSSRDLHPLDFPAPREIAPLVDAINQLMKRLDRSLGSMQSFIADAAHQLRTPLASMQLHTELALRERDIQAIEASLEEVHESARRATRLANQLLDHARANTDSSALAIADLDLVALAAETTSESVPLARKRDIDLGFAAEGSIKIRGDLVLIRELIRNLIDNAVRYCPDGARITVRVRTRSKDGNAQLEIEDNGPGIDPSERERVFDRFYRPPQSTGDGSGLGLAIVRDVAHVHGGSVSLHDAGAGRGLKVEVLLPLAESTSKNAP